MSFAIKPAIRSGIRPLVGFYGRSGGGKTRSALLLARGIVGPKGRIVLIDTESGRGSIFADKIQGGYNVIDLDPPFNPLRYVEAIEEAEKHADIVVIDSLSHAWAGDGGVLDMQESELYRMAKDDYKRREACKMAAWIKPKAELSRLVQNTILRLKLPLVCCLRGELKTHMGKKQDGRTEVYTDEWSTPIFDQRFIFEMLVCAECYSEEGKGGYLHITKITNEDLFDCLPGEGHQVTIQHGELMAEWSKGGSSPGQQANLQASKQASNPIDFRGELLRLTADIHRVRKGDDPSAIKAGKERLHQWLFDNDIILAAEDIDRLTPDRWPEVLQKAQETLNQQTI